MSAREGVARPELRVRGFVARRATADSDVKVGDVPLRATPSRSRGSSFSQLREGDWRERSPKHTRLPEKGNTKMITFRSIVLGYWRKEGRHDLPWRKTHDPYKILVSEVMLQQTQVERVIPKYNAFIKRFPTARALAKAPLRDVLALWSGLGYNRRAKYLHDAVKIVVSEYSGDFAQALSGKLPGVGPYTRTAVRAFAFNEPGVVIETNIRTVFIHHFFPKQKKVSDEALAPLIEQAMWGQDAREWYSALMDYGAYLKRSGVKLNAKSKSYTKQSKFDGSLRQVRGAILRTHTEKKSLQSVKKRFPDRFEKALLGLKKDGLI